MQILLPGTETTGPSGFADDSGYGGSEVMGEDTEMEELPAKVRKGETITYLYRYGYPLWKGRMMLMLYC